MTVTIYHNPRCSKSRQTLELLRRRGIEPTIVEYLEEPPDRATLETLLGQLGLEPRELMRKGESIYKELGLSDPGLDHAALVSAMLEHPILIERPIVRGPGGTALGRPPEAALRVL